MVTNIEKYTDLESLNNAEDGVVAVNASLLRSSEFRKEKELETYIVDNIEHFAKSILDDNVISFEVDSPITQTQPFGPRGKRIDLLIQGVKSNYIIELKNPANSTENRAAIGQILDYGREFLDSKKELIIITSKFDIDTARTIRHYNLPIRYIYLDKKRFLEFAGESL